MGKMYVKSEASSGQENTAVQTQRPVTEKQYGIITDLIAAGEIQGLVGGLSGVYFNGISLPVSYTHLRANET